MAENVPRCTAFISYAHQDRAHGGRVKQLLGEVGIDAFLAHEDIEVSDAWRERILDELKRCKLFIPLLSAYFTSSRWAPQEVGFITSRLDEVVVAPLSLDGTLPAGFLSHVQACRIPEQGISRELLVEPLASKLPREILPGLIQTAVKAGSYRGAEAAMRPLVALFAIFTPEEAQTLAEGSVKNGQIWPATLCSSDYLPAFIRVQGPNIAPATLAALQHQIKTGEWYRDV